MKLKNTSIAVALLLSGPIGTASAGTTLASSTFDMNQEGWTGITTTGSSSWSVVTSGITPAMDSDGNPGNTIVLQDPDTQWTYFSAPSAFLGDKSAAFGGTLAFDSTYFLAGASYVNEADVVLKGAGITLVYDATNALPAWPTWMHFQVSLAAGAWRVADTFSGALATDAQMQSVLANLDALWINAEHFTPVQEAIALDNVVLSAPVPEPESAAMMLAGLVLMGMVFRRKA